MPVYGLRSMVAGYDAAAPPAPPSPYSIRPVTASPSFSPGLLPSSMVGGAKKLGPAPFPPGFKFKVPPPPPKYKSKMRGLRRFSRILRRGRAKGLVRFVEYDGIRKREVFRRSLSRPMTAGEKRFNYQVQRMMRAFRRRPSAFRAALRMLDRYFGPARPARRPSSVTLPSVPVMGLETPTSYTYTTAPASTGFGIGVI